MSATAIGTSVASYFKGIVSGGGPATSPANAAAAAAQEANEPRTTTVKEAQRGDKVAQKKLLKLQAKADAQTAETKPAEPGKGDLVDRVA